MKKQVVYFDGEPVGALVPEKGTLRFMAVKYSVWTLDGEVFASLDAARKAVDAMLSSPAAKNVPAMPPASHWQPHPGDLREGPFQWNASSPVPRSQNVLRRVV